MKFSSIKDIAKKVPTKNSFKHHLKMAEDGRVVKGVNTTPDVDTNSISKEASKFGNKVDKDGRPPTLSKKVKGSSTNVAFNLGMTEAKKGKDDRLIKQRDPNWRDMEALRKSGAAGSHKDKTKTIPRKDKYKPKFDEAKELASASEIYVDMDGVLVDFFGAWTKMMGVDNWKQIKNVDTALQKIRDDEDFWLKLKPTKNAGKLLGIIKRIKGEYNILSAPLAGDPKAEPHKREWIKKYLTVFPPKNVIITADKQKYATQSDGTPNILIDDFGQNVAKWEGAGGVGFKHKDHKFERTAQQLADYISPEKSEQIAEILGFATKNPKRTTIKKKRPPEEDSVQDKLKKRRAMKASGNPDAFKSGAIKDWHMAHIAPNTYFLTNNLEEGELVVPARDLRNFVQSMLGELDPKTPENAKTLADIAKMLGKEVTFKNNRAVITDPKTDEGSLIPQPKNTFLTKADAGYDHYQIGTNLANLKNVPTDSNVDEPDIMIAPYAGEKEMRYLQKELKRIGYDVQDADGYRDAHFDDPGENDVDEGYLYARRNAQFNEGYKLQLERDQEMLVLHIKDTATGKRTEVRGKSGYESGNYDADDKLHQLLDKVGKSVDISQLMNGEPVGINPKHPQGTSAKDATDKAYNENFADGKKKGKSRPGRVKRSGASCNGSVTALRKRAKNASGEKAKMYHWCANMKSGRKKGK